VAKIPIPNTRNQYYDTKTKKTRFIIEDDMEEFFRTNNITTKEQYEELKNRLKNE
jgi:hypothetical protein